MDDLSGQVNWLELKHLTDKILRPLFIVNLFVFERA